MLIQTRGIVLHRSAYTDRYNIVHLYTEEYGRLGLLLSNGHTRRSGQISRALLPLSEVEFIGDMKRGRQLATIKELRLYCPNTNLHLHPAKSSQSIFLSEVLYRILSEEAMPDADLYSFLSQSFAFLDRATEGIANFYLCFCYHLLRYLAIEPSITLEALQPTLWFDLGEAQFTATPSLSNQAIPPHWCQYLYTFSRINYNNMHAYRYNREQRAIIIDFLLLYYRLHLPSFGAIKSLEVLRQTARKE